MDNKKWCTTSSSNNGNDNDNLLVYQMIAGVQYVSQKELDRK